MLYNAVITLRTKMLIYVKKLTNEHFKMEFLDMTNVILHTNLTCYSKQLNRLILITIVESQSTSLTITTNWSYTIDHINQLINLYKQRTIISMQSITLEH